jgi:hypothetical protein
MWRIVLTALALALPAIAQCPNQVIVRKPVDVSVGHELKCGGISLNRDGFELETRGCPAFVIIVPAHDATDYRPGSGTYTSPAGRVDVTLLQYDCGTDWFLIVPIGSSCERIGERVVAQLTTYAQFSCEHEPSPKPEV